MKKAAIGIDSWKLDIFEKNLTEAGFTYENAGRFSEDTLMLIVYTDDVKKLEKVVRKANAEAARSKLH